MVLPIVDREYFDYAELADTLKVPLDLQPGFGGGFRYESDWYWRAHGRGAPSGPGQRQRWLVTYVTPDGPDQDKRPEAPAQGWLVAHHINAADQKTGRCIVLAGPWNEHTDKAACMDMPHPHDDVDLDELLGWLRSWRQ